jgi:hypothetical protein
MKTLLLLIFMTFTLATFASDTDRQIKNESDQTVEQLFLQFKNDKVKTVRSPAVSKIEQVINESSTPEPQRFLRERELGSL